MASNVLVPDALGSVDAGSVDIALFAARGQIQLLATRWSQQQQTPRGRVLHPSSAPSCTSVLGALFFLAVELLGHLGMTVALLT